MDELIVKQYLRDGEVVKVSGDASLHDRYAMFPEVEDDDSVLTVDDEVEESSEADAEEDSDAEPETNEVVVEGSGIETVEAAEEAVEPAEEEVDEGRPGGNASAEDWHAYRLANGYSEEELADLGRNELRDLADR